MQHFKHPLLRLILLTVTIKAGFGQLAAPVDHHLQLGRIRVAPEGFIDLIGEWRSATTTDTVWTQFGRIPLTPSNSQNLLSLAHSRGMVHVDAPLGPVTFTTYLEQDFMRSSNGIPFRWRQYWTRGKIGNWEVLGGQTWSLLRPNRVGIEPDRALMNTDALEPNYQVGLVGQRRRQVRLGYSSETWKIALAWEAEKGLWVGKYAKDGKNAHLEIAGFTGRGHVNGVSLAQVVRIAPKLRIVGQQFASKGALAEALGIVPYSVSGISSLIGAEVPATATLNLFAYYGFVYGSKSNSNRLTAQSSVGFHQQLWRSPDAPAAVILSAQFSHVDRAIWSGSAGSMDYVQTSVRYTFK